MGNVIIVNYSINCKRYCRTESRMAFADGRAQGISQGSRQAKLETAKLLKQLGDSVQKIMQVTGLSKADVEGA